MPRGRRRKVEEEENVSNAKTTPVENVLSAKTTPVEKRTLKQTKSKVEKKSTLKTNPVIEKTVKPVKPKGESLQVADATNHDEPINGKNENTKVTKETKPKTRRNRKKITTEDILSDIAIQYGDKETSVLKIVEKVKQDCKDKGYRKQIRKVSIYVKPEDGKVYYALDNNTDSIELFDNTAE